MAKLHRAEQVNQSFLYKLNVFSKVSFKNVCHTVLGNLLVYCCRFQLNWLS